MTSRERVAIRLTHQIAAELHRALSNADMTVEEVAAKMVESPAFIRRILIGEDHIGQVVYLDFLAGFAWATKQTLVFAIIGESKHDDEESVKSDGEPS